MRLKRFAITGLAVVALLGSGVAARALTIELSPKDGGGAIAAAVSAARAHPDVPVDIRLKAGTYYLDHTLTFTAADARSATAPLTIEPDGAGEVTISAGRCLKANWSPARGGIMQTPVPADADFDQLFVNGQLQHLARYPNYDARQHIFGGTSPEAIAPARVRTWHDPVGGYVHALQRASWGSVSYRITGVKPDGTLQLEGGWQNNRPMGMNSRRVFVEGIFEELDAPGEWYLNRSKHVLYYWPTPGLDLAQARIEVSGFAQAVDFAGTMQHPVRYITLRGLRIMHTARTFMQTKEPLLRSDWRIYRGGAVTITGGQFITLDGCVFDDNGGNAVFVSDYNRHITVEHCIIKGVGASGVCFVGSPTAVRNPLFEYHQSQKYSAIDLTPGPKTDDYPADCLVDDCLIHDIGRVELQVAGVEIDMAARITVRHCSIYDCPRAGINIGDGCWGGDVIEYCDVFNTVQATGDNGSFNSWGRDRYWHLAGVPKGALPELAKLDTVEPIILRNNRWRCDHGWDIDLDDGSSNYQIINNVCLHGGLKNREGYYRDDENNVLVGCAFYPQVWFVDSQDVFAHNIVQGGYRPAFMYHKWGKEIDYNLLPNEGALAESRKRGNDLHSLAGNPEFLDASHGDYRVAKDSPALRIGFQNFPMDEFGVSSPRLRALAQTPALPGAPVETHAGEAGGTVDWQGASLKKLAGLAERSVTGMGEDQGLLVVGVREGSRAQRLGLKPQDVILECNNVVIHDVSELARAWDKTGSKGTAATLEIWRNQRKVRLQANQNQKSQ